MSTVGMDVVLSVPNRYQFHRQSQPASVVFYLQLPHGDSVPVIGQQSGTGSFVCNSPVPNEPKASQSQRDVERAGQIDLVQLKGLR